MDNTELIKVNKKVLSNGLRLVHHYMPETAMVTLNVLYNVGARREDSEMTGIAHLFEHIMFGGSENVADFDNILTSAGGMSNAWTGNDFTNFFEIAPAHNAETLFFLESDRMLSPIISETTLNIQRSVVIEEYKQQCLNAPYGDIIHQLRPLLYERHPYSWPVIGKSIDHLNHIQHEDVQKWWTNNYYPSNAVLSIAGKISFDETCKLAHKWFERVPPRTPSTPLLDIPCNDLKGRKKAIVFGNVPATMIVIAYLMSGYGSKEYFAADAITDILAAGQASRFYQRITMNPESPIVEADASISGSEDRGMIMLTARLANENIDLNKATDFLIHHARSIITEGISEYELQRLKNKQNSMFVISNMSCVTCAQTIAEAEMHDEYPGEKLNVYNSLTSNDIENTAKDIFDHSHPAILYYRPK